MIPWDLGLRRDQNIAHNGQIKKSRLNNQSNLVQRPASPFATVKKNSSSVSTDNSAPSRGKWRTFIKRAIIASFVLTISLAITLILCRKSIAARVIEEQLLASGFSRAEVTIDTLGTESIGGTIKGDTTISGEFAEGQLTFFIHCPWQEIVNRTFGQLDITLQDVAILIDPTITPPEPTAQPDPSPAPEPAASPPTPQPSLRETLADIHGRISNITLASPIRIGRRRSDHYVTAHVAWLSDTIYSHGNPLKIEITSTQSPKIAHARELLTIPPQARAPHKPIGYFRFNTDLNLAALDTIEATFDAYLFPQHPIPFLPEPWRSYQPIFGQCHITTTFQWAPDDTLELRTFDIATEALSIDHPDYGKLVTKEARYTQTETSKQLHLTDAHGEIRLPSGASITLPETTPLIGRVTATYKHDQLDQLTASITSDAWIYNHGAPMGSVDLGDIAVTNLDATLDYRDHPSPWQRRAFLTLRANTYGAAINSVGAFLTDLNTIEPFLALGGIAFADLPLETVDLPDALVPVLVEYELAGSINGQLALGIDSAKPDPLTTLSLTANGTALGIKHREDPIHISGGDLTIHFPNLRKPITLQDQRFSIASADAGSIKTKDIIGKMSLDADANLLLSDAKGTAFGGTIRLKKATIPADDSPYTLDLLFEHVDAADLVALYPDFKGTITGELSGRVPIVFGSKTLPRAGKLQLDENSISTLRYDASDLFNTDSQRDQIIRTALADLNVTTLDVFIFDPTRPKGEINIVIGGTSNKLFNGAPVPLEAFNINMDLSEAEDIIFHLLTSINGLSFE